MVNCRFYIDPFKGNRKPLNPAQEILLRCSAFEAQGSEGGFTRGFEEEGFGVSGLGV